MITFIAYVLTMLGSINWLLIGLLQYDFIAGLFGFQASIFSRLVYIVFGFGSIYFTIRIIANKGTFKIYERKNKKQNKTKTLDEDTSNNKEQPYTQTSQQNNQEQPQQFKQETMFDEHINNGM